MLDEDFTPIVPGHVTVLTVCLGNICRSPMAAAVLRDRVTRAGLAERVDVASAGTSGWHVGQGADRRAAATLRRHGYDATHTVRQLTADDLATHDLVLVADRSNLTDANDLARTPTEAARIALFRSFDRCAPAGAEIPDPYYGEGDGFERVLAMIEAAADGLVADLGRLLGSDPPS